MNTVTFTADTNVNTNTEDTAVTFTADAATAPVAAEVKKDGRGRPDLFDDNKKLVQFLATVDLNDLTHYMKTKLVKAGLLTITYAPREEGKRGRNKEILSLSGKARGKIALARNWGAKKAKTAEATETSVAA